MLAEAIYGRRATATFAQAVLSYLEHGGSKRFLELVIEHFGTTPLVKIDQDAIDRGARKLYPNASGATRNRQFYTPVSAVMTHAARRGWCPRLLLDRPASSKERVRWLTPEEAERLIEACSDHMGPLVIFLLYTGARVGEALWLDWHDLDLKRGHVSFPKTKNGEARGVALHARLTAVLANLPHREGAVFRRPDGLPYERPEADDEEHISAGSRISTAFAGACRRAGITNFHPHDCRHTWATWHYAANRDLGALQTLGGWKSVRMVMRYAHVNVDELRHTIDRLPGGKPMERKVRKAKIA
ncbi:MAG: site-specific integrase [Alphaproteobacteria bacterium]|nr:site-specific integrase [Alphaproteobacteria bacterium]